MAGHEWRYVRSNWRKPDLTPECSSAMHDLWECAWCEEQKWVEEWSDDWGLVGPGGAWVDYVGPKTMAPDSGPDDGSCDIRAARLIIDL